MGVRTMKTRKIICQLFLLPVASAFLSTSCIGVPSSSTYPDLPASSVKETAVIRLDQNEVVLQEGDTLQLKATVFASFETPSWTSSDPSVCMVSPAGLLTGKKVGSCQIEARIGTSSAVCQVTVNASTKLPVLCFSEERVSLSVNGTLEVSCGAYFGRNQLTGVVISYAFGADFEPGIFSFEVKDNGTVSLQGSKEGQGSLYASAMYQGTTLTARLEVTVVPALYYRVEVTNLSPVQGGFAVSLFSKESANGHASITPEISLYHEDELIASPSFSWTSSAPSIASMEAGVITAHLPGEAVIIGRYSDGYHDADVKFFVTVTLPYITLSDTFTCEREGLLSFNLSAASLSTIGKETITSVQLEGKEVGTYTSGTIALQKNNLPSYAAKMGEQKLLLVSAKAIYEIPFHLYTKIIRSKDDLAAMGNLAKAAIPGSTPRTGEFAMYTRSADTIPLWDGYFVLGNDIDFSGRYQSPANSMEIWSIEENGTSWENGMLYGFRGVFDGQGHNIQGMRIDEAGQSGGLFGVLHAEGRIQNVSFTDAFVARSTGFLCSAGAGRIENVYIRYTSLGGGTKQGSRRYGSCFVIQAERTATLKNAFFDAVEAKVSDASECLLLGLGEGSENVYGVSLDSAIVAASPVDGIYASYEEFMARDIHFTGEVWGNYNGLPLFQNLYEKAKDENIVFSHVPTVLPVNSSYLVQVSGHYLSLGLEHAVGGVSLSEGVLNIASTVSTGETVKLKASSLLNEEKSAEASIQIASFEEVDKTGEEGYVLLDLAHQTMDPNGIADLPSASPSGFLDATRRFVSWDELSSGSQSIGVIADSKIYWVNALVVDSIISDPQELADLSYQPNGRTVIDGYYLLGQDLDASGTSLTNAGYSWNRQQGFVGVFDGRGHRIQGLTLAGQGLFGTIGAGARIQNVTFTDLHLGANQSYVFAKAIKGAELRNLSFTLTEVNANREAGGMIAQVMSQGTSLENINIDTGSAYVGWVIAKNAAIDGKWPDNTYTDVSIVTTHQNKILGWNSEEEKAGDYLGIQVAYTDAA